MVVSLEAIDRCVIDTVELCHRPADLSGQKLSRRCEMIVAQDLPCDCFPFDRTHDHEPVAEHGVTSLADRGAAASMADADAALRAAWDEVFAADGPLCALPT